MPRIALTLIALLGCVTAARAQAAAPIRSGTYDLEVTIGGGVLEGTLVITTVGDSLDARLKVGGHDSPVRPARQGSKLVLESAAGTAVRYQLEFKGDEVTGSFIYDGEPGTVTGKRRRASGS